MENKYGHREICYIKTREYSLDQDYIETNGMNGENNAYVYVEVVSVF